MDNESIIDRELNRQKALEKAYKDFKSTWIREPNEEEKKRLDEAFGVKKEEKKGWRSSGWVPDNGQLVIYLLNHRKFLSIGNFQSGYYDEDTGELIDSKVSCPLSNCSYVWQYSVVMWIPIYEAMEMIPMPKE